MKKAYRKRELFAQGPQRTFSGRSLEMVSLPLGGIGAGSVGLSGRGGLVDWEIFNRPNVGSILPRTFAIIWAQREGEQPVCRVAQAPEPPPYQHGGTGEPCASGEGFPHMDACTFRGEYPFGWVDFTCEKLPVEVSLEAYNPFIPSDAEASGYPAAILRYTLRNPGPAPVRATLAWSLLNAVGSIGEAARLVGQADVEHGLGGSVNTPVSEGDLHGLLFSSTRWPEDHPRFGTMALLTPHRETTTLRYWLREGWFDANHDFWDRFSATGRFPERDYPDPSPPDRPDAGAVGAIVEIAPGASETIPFYVTWHFPNFEHYWGATDAQGKRPVWRNYYAQVFDDALDVGRKLHAEEAALYARTRQFHDALFSSTLPAHVLDAVSSQMSILKTTTCLRLTDGTFYGFEGCNNVAGCCEGSCTHVWNYQQTLPFLFPALERSMRTADYAYNMRDDGGMCFRLQLPLGADPNAYHACGDGQMGGVIKTYRDWKISGDDAWLRSLWPSVKRALEYAWVQWDPDRDGVMTGIQHNTYDIEFVGANPLMGCFYLGALAAGAEMAAYLGESDVAATYRAVYEKGRAWIDAHLFNGEYYEQQYDPAEAPRFQFGAGCLSDQALGQWIAQVAGLGHVIDQRHLRKALKSVFRYNWREELGDHANAQRVFVTRDEAGLLLCSWPRGGRPAIPFVYSDEVWSGIEYQVASHLILEGFVREGLAIVKGVRERHDGVRRNPWNEYECGHHYARAMAAYGLLLAGSGFSFDRGAERIGFAPAFSERPFRCFWALDGVWGTYEETERTARIDVLYGRLRLRRLDLALLRDAADIRADMADGPVEAERIGSSVRFGRSLMLKEGQWVEVAIAPPSGEQATAAQG